MGARRCEGGQGERLEGRCGMMQLANAPGALNSHSHKHCAELQLATRSFTFISKGRWQCILFSNSIQLSDWP